MFTEFNAMLAELVRLGYISGATAKAQLNYLQCGGGVIAEIRNMYNLVPYGDEQFYEIKIA